MSREGLCAGDEAPPAARSFDELLSFVAAALEGPDAQLPPPTDAIALRRFVRDRSGLLYDLAARAWMSAERPWAELLAVAASVGRHGEEAADDYADPALRLLRAACRRVDREIDRLKGFARFAEGPRGLVVAALEPDHDVIAALVPHFQRRFGAQGFAIVDLKRGKAIAAEGGAILHLQDDEALALLAGGGEDPNAELWRRYFAAVENPARRNPALQRRLMPARYWSHLTELGGDSAAGGAEPSRDDPERVH